MAEQHDSHVLTWGQSVVDHAAAELRAQLHATLTASGMQRALNIANGAVAGAAQFWSDALGPAWAADALAQFQSVAADYAAREAAAVPRVLN